jgi:adenine phosphoribosyltransferase
MLEMIKAQIRDIPDFPAPGILFKDITPLLGHPDAFTQTIHLLAERYREQPIDYVVGVEARGFVVGAALAAKLNTGFVMVRKPGKLPADTLQATYELEYGSDTLEIHRDALPPGARVILVDDVLATGGTMSAVIELVNALQGKIHELAFLIELTFLNGRDRLQGHNLFSLIQY